MARSIILAVCVCSLLGSANTAIAAEPSVVYLHGGRDSALPDGPRNYQGLLARELIRQALLCAARDELGCSTIDLHLGQPAPAGAMHIDIVAVRGVDRADAPPTELQVLRGVPPMQELIVAATFKPKVPIDIVELVRLLESHSRGTFVKHLKQTGIVGSARPWNNKNLPDEESLQSLAEMNVVSQFRAVCALHAQIESNGRSPFLIAALVRTYANLAVLTEMHWAPAHKVFAARSLLYAQRLVAGKHDNTHAFTSRAYAFALAGLHQAALDDLDTLDKLVADKKAKPGELQRILRSYCSFRIDELDPVRCEKQHTELVRLLRLLAREHGGSARQTIEEALSVTQAMPHCYRAQHSVGLRAGVSLGHVVTVQGIANTVRTLYPRLTAISNLPAEVKAALPNPKLADGARGAEMNIADEFVRRAKVASALENNEAYVGKQHQLTWPVLGHLLEEHSFVETYIRARFERRMLGAAPDRFLDFAKPLYRWHPLAAVVDFFREDRALTEQSLVRAAEIDLDTLELQADELARVVPKEVTSSAKRRSDEAHFMAVMHMDNTASDLLKTYAAWSGERAKEEALRAYAISPHAPLARNHLVMQHWNKVEPQLDQWLRDAAGDASQQAALGVHYQREKEWDKAIEYLQKAKDLSPELVNIRLLAEAHKSRGQVEKWQSTLEELLKQPDYGLEHAKIRVEIADYYISRHEYQKALPFALQAAGTRAEWALLAAAQCFEALQKWDEAESMYRTASQGYDDFHWFCFTQRTGYGDANAAKQLARASLVGHGGTKIPSLVRYFILRTIGERQQAREQSEETYTKQPDLSHGLHLMLLTDEQKDFGRRDAVMAELQIAAAARSPGAPPLGLAALVEAFSKDLAAGGKAEFDPKALLAAKEGALVSDVGPFDYFLGKYLQLHGKPKAAEEIWLMRMRRNNMSHFHRTLCGIELRALGVGPEAYKEALQKAIPDGQPPDAPPR